MDETTPSGMTTERARELAQEHHSESLEIDVDDDAVVSHGVGGAWVAAWVWVPSES